jgi:hypothetical protein
LRPATADLGDPQLNVQRHQASSIGWVAKIVDTYQFNDGVIRANHRFSRRNEVFVTAEDEASYTRAAQRCNCAILCRRDIRCPKEDGHLDKVAGRSNGRKSIFIPSAAFMAAAAT